MEILFACLHQINAATETVERILINRYTEDLKTYILDTVNQINDNEIKRRFWFSGEETTITKVVNSYLNGDYESVCELAPNKLVKVEKKAQKGIEHFTELQKGSLFQIVIDIEGIKRIFILKAENTSFLDDIDMIKRGGLPTSEKRKVYKAFVAKITDDDEVEKVFVYDTHPKIVKYWWDSFLELNEERTDVYNTDKAFNAIVKKVLNPIRKVSTKDYHFLHQSTVSFFLSNQTFNLQNYINEVITDYLPQSPEIIISDIIEKIKDLPSKYDFDTHFTIDSTTLKGTDLNKVIPLRENLDLKIKGVVEDFKNIIIPEIGNDGKKYLKIQSDNGFDEFNQ